MGYQITLHALVYVSVHCPAYRVAPMPARMTHHSATPMASPPREKWHQDYRQLGHLPNLLVSNYPFAQENTA
jgi:hypothetical protein